MGVEKPKQSEKLIDLNNLSGGLTVPSGMTTHQLACSLEPLQDLVCQDKHALCQCFEQACNVYYDFDQQETARAPWLMKPTKPSKFQFWLVKRETIPRNALKDICVMTRDLFLDRQNLKAEKESAETEFRDLLSLARWPETGMQVRFIKSTGVYIATLNNPTAGELTKIEILYDPQNNYPYNIAFYEPGFVRRFSSPLLPSYQEALDRHFVPQSSDSPPTT